MTNGDTFQKLQNVIGHLQWAFNESAGLLVLDVLNETDAKQVTDTLDVFNTLIAGFQEMSQRYLLEES
jgi:hypothetical protein